MQLLLLLLIAGSSAIATAPDCVAVGGVSEEPGTLLHYDALLAGVKVGEAIVRLRIEDDRYEVSGSALAQGMLDRLSEWRTRFRALGRLTLSEVQPSLFSYLETDRSKRREVVVRDGLVQVTKNGKVRSARATPPGVDVLSGLFVRPHCQGDKYLHTGRHAYSLTRLSSEPGRCRYMVIDDDQDRYEVDVVFTNRDGLIVPRRIVYQGVLNGFVELREPGPAPGGPVEPPVDPSAAGKLESTVIFRAQQRENHHAGSLDH